MRNSHWSMFLSDDYKIMTTIVVHHPFFDNTPSDSKDLFTEQEVVCLNRLVDSSSHPVFYESMSDELFDSRMKEFRERLMRWMREKIPYTE